MIRRISLLVFCLLGAAPAAAQERLGHYLAWIGPEDMQSSTGTPLASVAAMLQQDRANYHRFGIRQYHDSGDPFFTTTEARAHMAELYARGGAAPASIVNGLMRGEPQYIIVIVYGVNGVPTRLDVDWGAG